MIKKYRVAWRLNGEAGRGKWNKDVEVKWAWVKWGNNKYGKKTHWVQVV